MRWKKAGITVGVIAGVFLVMKYAVPVMLPFLLGWLLALAILPAARCWHGRNSAENCILQKAVWAQC